MSWVARHPRWSALGCLALAMGVFLRGPYLELSQRMQPLGTFDEVPVTGLADAEARLALLGEDARVALSSHLLWDLPFFLLQGLAFGLWVLSWRSTRWRWLCCLPVACMVGADLVENTSQAFLLWEGMQAGWVSTLGWATSIKLACLPGVPLALLGPPLLSAWFKRRMASRLRLATA